MIYLSNMELLNHDKEMNIISKRYNIHTSLYPMGLFSQKEFHNIEFEPITIFYGGNGSGKTTLLKIISQVINASKRNVDKVGSLFDEYVNGCYCEIINQDECKAIKYISSDDIFDYLLDVRAINSNVNRRKEELIEEYMNAKYNDLDDNASFLEHYDELKNKVDSRKMTASKFIRTRLGNNNTIQESNGETALDFWQNEIGDNSLYIIDEPENSLSAENQLKLKQFLEESARFYNCQFVIATHSPFLLALKGAKVYDLDEVPVVAKKWTELANVKAYNQFFSEHKNEFED